MLALYSGTMVGGLPTVPFQRPVWQDNSVVSHICLVRDLFHAERRENRGNHDFSICDDGFQKDFNRIWRKQDFEVWVSMRCRQNDQNAERATRACPIFSTYVLRSSYQKFNDFSANRNLSCCSWVSFICALKLPPNKPSLIQKEPWPFLTYLLVGDQKEEEDLT